jgi:peptidoglycan/LPS O-acetylase OafA/YrhL
MKTKLHQIEAIRGFASIYVFTGHLILARFILKSNGLCFFFRFGQEAVMLFFLLSGFVICYTSSRRPNTGFGRYFLRRLRRIYPIFLLALILAFLFGDLWSTLPATHASTKQVLGNLFMLQDFQDGKPGVYFRPLYGNLALWSLSYEWWFYMLFYPIYYFVPERYQIHLVATLSIMGFLAYEYQPNQPSLFLKYFVIWWAGAELGRSYAREMPITFRSQKLSLVYLGLFAALTAMQVVVANSQATELRFGIHPVLELRHFFAAFALICIGILWYRLHWVGFDQLLGPFQKIAPISYALYAFHFPLAVQSNYLHWVSFPALELVGYCLIAVTISYFAEVPLQSWINRKTDFLLR